MTEIIIQNKVVSFTPDRIPKEERKEKLFYYELRHGDDWGIPLTVEDRVVCNFYGTIVSEVAFELDSTNPIDSYYELTEEEKDAFLCM